ncbi:ATP-binding cassette domain-containing protein [Paraburkholderia caballeronis]|uniref:Probable ATP-binding protein YheS n=1 Tax=Paraburkholderia caballeronis TaxID=416943 RepID=A0A1H7NC07_9BURK|nr:ATP-binding cassette domain-containing protein [Paraburkholderia caballeronis]PXW26179.1 ATP-binding cassette subfamily F protein 3 [Paraburkholderia caballeronis]PXX01726.1 ATP-binding cassette subfamily F protein 3 [Paraburkholderia caballeronis]RAK00883.1 ATP-binding cassette subfamily F protein 3 [Paraburkholderia caballeronis]SEC09889.1 ATP-binding cassette, subfamily F, member 3 [Paraburkholderia caballeronis]SEL20809.1 ATP-binding cassette, subfamily F, member 3 [Paraburkholderia cab
MIRFNQFSLARGTKPLFDQTSFTLNPGEKAGLVGANGAGKSTLFAVLRGELHADGGDFSLPPSWQIAHVAQETPAVERSALDYTLDGDAALRDIEARIAAASAAHDGAAEAEAHAAFADADGYTAPARAEALLLGLGFTLEQTRQPVGSFSGGWRMRLNLAQALMCRSDLLLLDEPTNHLDLDAIVWLEDWLHRYPGTLVVISHDREFLDAICNVTLHLEQQQIKRYGGNYSQFEILRAQQLALQQSAYEKQQRTVAHLQSFIDRFKAKATKARQAQSRVKALEKMELIAPAHAASPFTFEFRTPDSAPNPMLVMDDVRCGYRNDDGHEIPIVEHVALSIQNGQRIGLLGANGQGKSTLIKTLAGTLAPLAGDLRTGKGLQIGYFAQHQLETLRPDDSPLQHLARLAPDTREQELRDFLGGFNFAGEMATAPIAPFSGGEKARLALALIIWQKPNLLLLDEPTNHLDLETRHALTMALAQFDGTLILVSHDRHLLRATTDQFMLVAKHRLQPFDGDLDDYRDWLLQHAAEQRAASKQDAESGANGDGGANRKELRRQEAETRQKLSQLKKPLQNRIGKIEKEMDALNAEKGTLDAFIADPASYEPAQKAKLTDAIRRQAQVQSRLDELEAQWLEAHEELEQIG